MRTSLAFRPPFIAGFVDKRRRKVAGNPFEEINGFPQIDAAVESQRQENRRYVITFLPTSILTSTCQCQRQSRVHHSRGKYFLQDRGAHLLKRRACRQSTLFALQEITASDTLSTSFRLIYEKEIDRITGHGTIKFFSE